jgi:tripartite-type tricarboxylate transporter receptor subunit TctC
VAGAYNHVKSGKLKPMAVSSTQRASSLPDVPTFAESGVSDFNAASWVGFLAPAQTPAAIIQKLNAELNATLNDPVVRDKLRVLGIEATPGSPDAFRDEIRRDLGRYGPVVKAAGIQVE